VVKEQTVEVKKTSLPKNNHLMITSWGENIKLKK